MPRIYTEGMAIKYESHLTQSGQNIPKVTANDKLNTGKLSLHKASLVHFALLPHAAPDPTAQKRRGGEDFPSSPPYEVNPCSKPHAREIKVYLASH
jgi:hypothetical protein